MITCRHTMKIIFMIHLVWTSSMLSTSIELRDSRQMRKKRIKNMTMIPRNPAGRARKRERHRLLPPSFLLRLEEHECRVPEKRKRKSRRRPRRHGPQPREVYHPPCRLLPHDPHHLPSRREVPVWQLFSNENRNNRKRNVNKKHRCVRLLFECGLLACFGWFVLLEKNL